MRLSLLMRLLDFFVSQISGLADLCPFQAVMESSLLVLNKADENLVV